MNRLSFKEAVFLVHPDTNPDIIDAGVKMRTILHHKKDEVALYNFINLWKLLPHQIGKPETIEKKVYILPNTLYNGSVSVGIDGIGMIKVFKTTAHRVYFTKEEKERTGRTWCNSNKIKCAIKDI